jgi:hypothetical protein
MMRHGQAGATPPGGSGPEGMAAPRHRDKPGLPCITDRII